MTTTQVVAEVCRRALPDVPVREPLHGNLAPKGSPEVQVHPRRADPDEIGQAAIIAIWRPKAPFSGPTGTALRDAVQAELKAAGHAGVVITESPVDLGLFTTQLMLVTLWADVAASGPGRG